MSRDGKMTYQLAGANASPPTSSSYWVVEGLLLAGAYPGDPQPEKHRAKVQALVDAGIRTFVNLMEAEETNYAGLPFVPYQDLAATLCPEVTCARYPIRDLSVPTALEMASVLAAIDSALEIRKPVYVHCWGGVGRTGTVVGCWLVQHGLVPPEEALGVLARLRAQDKDRGGRRSPETAEQRRMVENWTLAGR